MYPSVWIYHFFGGGGRGEILLEGKGEWVVGTFFLSGGGGEEGWGPGQVDFLCVWGFAVFFSKTLYKNKHTIGFLLGIIR